MNKSHIDKELSEFKAILKGGDYPKAYYQEVLERAIAVIDAQCEEIKNLYISRADNFNRQSRDVKRNGWVS